MATIKLAVLKHTKAKDGTYKIRISIGHSTEKSDLEQLIAAVTEIIKDFN